MSSPNLVIEDYNSSKDRIETFLDDTMKIITSTCSSAELEGNAFYYHLSANRFFELFSKQVNLFWCGRQVTKRICEIGFNAGHSAFLFLLGMKSPKVEFTVFDLGEHPYTRPCLEHLKKTFPESNFSYIEGDSTNTLPEWTTSHPEASETYDVVHVDGGHTYECAHSDIMYGANLVRPGGYLIVDDTNVSYISSMVDALVRSEMFTEVEILRTVGYEHRILQRKAT
jgi:hypothetical protein